jgi:DNA-binding MarR family transcriptional regulator
VIDLFESILAFVKAFRSRPTSDGGLTGPQLACLSLLNRHSPLRLTSLAEEMRCDLSVLSRQAGALEVAGLIARARDPHDGRACLVELTAAGRERLYATWAANANQLKLALSGFDDSAIVTAAAVLRRLTQHTTDETVSKN